MSSENDDELGKKTMSSESKTMSLGEEIRCSREEIMPESQRQLALRQQQLVASIFRLSQPQSQGLRIYQNNLLLTAARALTISYPVLQQLLGYDAMVVLAQRLLTFEPPASGNWADWGAELAEVLSHTDIVQAHPYVYDMARLEWQLHRIAAARVSQLDRDSLSLLEQNLAEVWIQLSPSVAWRYSDLPIDHIWRAHQSLESPEQLDSAALATALAENSGDCFLLLHRVHHKPSLQRIDEAQFHWLRDIGRGLSVAQLLEQHPQFDFVTWLGEAVANNWIEKLSDRRPGGCQGS